MITTLGPTAVRLSTRQLWVLRAVANDRVERRLLDGGLCTFDGRPVSWTLTVLAARGLVAFEPLLPSPPHLTRRGRTLLLSVGFEG